MANITISKTKIERQGGIVVLPVKEHERLLEQVVPTYYLSGQAAKRLDTLINKGLKDYQNGRTRRIKSLTDLD